MSNMKEMPLAHCLLCVSWQKLGSVERFVHLDSLSCWSIPRGGCWSGLESATAVLVSINAESGLVEEVAEKRQAREGKRAEKKVDTGHFPNFVFFKNLQLF